MFSIAGEGSDNLLRLTPRGVACGLGNLPDDDRAVFERAALGGRLDRGIEILQVLRRKRPDFLGEIDLQLFLKIVQQFDELEYNRVFGRP